MIVYAYVRVTLAGHPFWRCLRERRESSAWIPHSPLYGKNHTDRLATVRTWATVVGVVPGLVANVAITGRFLSWLATPAERDQETRRRVRLFFISYK